MTPDVLVIGDSHAIALQDGAELAGFKADGFYFSGAAWHQGRFAHGKGGFAPVRVGRAAREMEELRARVGHDQPFGMGLPVIASFGWHLGRLAPPFGARGHIVSDDPAGAETSASASRDFLADYVSHYRYRHFMAARRMARQSPTVFVAPPPSRMAPNERALRRAVAEMYRGAGLTVYDPADDFLRDDGTMDPALLWEDLHHGTSEYGRQVVTLLAERGLLPLRLSEAG